MSIIELEITISSEAAKKFVGMLRIFMRDSPAYNDLQQERETTDQDLALVTAMMIDDFNSLPPLFEKKFSLSEILMAGLSSAALKVAASHLLEMRFQQQERNELTYSDGSRTEVINNKSVPYKDTASRFFLEGMKQFEKWKVAYNLTSSYNSSAGLFSDYALVNNQI